MTTATSIRRTPWPQNPKPVTRLRRDLYKHAFRLSPLICSDLVADCFELAWDVRVLDMRAAPYDLADLGFAPVRIETAEGKAAYAEAQREFAERSAPLRNQLIEECRRLLSRVPTVTG